MDGKFVKKKVEESGVSLVTIAERMEIKPQRLQSIFKVEDIKVGLLQNIANAIDKDILYFLSDEIGAIDLSGIRRVQAIPKIHVDGTIDKNVKISVIQNENEDLTDSIAIEMDNDRMEPTIPDGATVLFNKLNKAEDIDYFVGVCCIVIEKRITVGRLMENNALNKSIMSISFDNPKYGKLNIRIKDIDKIYAAERIISSKIKQVAGPIGENENK